MSVSPRVNEYNQELQKLKAKYGIENPTVEVVKVDETNRVIELPRTRETLMEFLDTVIGAYNLPDTEYTREMIATMILHAPQDKSSFNISYFGERVQKALANKTAWELCEDYSKKRKEAEELNKKNEQADTTSEGQVATVTSIGTAGEHSQN